MEITEFASQILLGKTLEDKLLNQSIVINKKNKEFHIPNVPGRSSKISFSNKQFKFPKGGFENNERKAMALHSFANHELLAIELMALALLKFPQKTQEEVRVKQGIYKSLKDEQKHFKLYVKRLNELGYDFGDFPLNDFFWRQLSKMNTISEYFSVMALTFEAANLDFAHQFQNTFQEIEDFKTAKIMEIVYQDEISHVALGVRYLNLWKKEKSLWEYYLANLPFPLTPDRSKGKNFDADARVKAFMDQDFILNVKKYSSGFNITSRRSEVK